MKAAYYERKGPASQVLALGELPDPQPAAGEVRVKVRFSGLNPTDTKLRSGWDGAMEMPFPRIVPHQDGSGEIDRVGAGVPQARVGERVWIYEAQRGRAFGTAAEYVAVPAENAVALPEAASLETGACVGIAGMTAHRCLFQDGGIQGQTVLVAGGGGAVGHAAIQLAKWAGARVIATVSSPEKGELARRARADALIDYKSENVPERVMALTGDRGADVCFDPVGGELADAALSSLGWGGRMLLVGFVGGVQQIPANRLLVKNRSALGCSLRHYRINAPDKLRASVQALLGWYAAGKLKPHVSHRLPLERSVEAIRLLTDRKALGKIVVTLGS